MSADIAQLFLPVHRVNLQTGISRMLTLSRRIRLVFLQKRNETLLDGVETRLCGENRFMCGENVRVHGVTQQVNWHAIIGRSSPS